MLYLYFLPFLQNVYIFFIHTQNELLKQLMNIYITRN